MAAAFSECTNPGDLAEKHEIFSLVRVQKPDALTKILNDPTFRQEFLLFILEGVRNVRADCFVWGPAIRRYREAYWTECDEFSNFIDSLYIRYTGSYTNRDLYLQACWEGSFSEESKAFYIAYARYLKLHFCNRGNLTAYANQTHADLFCLRLIKARIIAEHGKPEGGMYMVRFF